MEEFFQQGPELGNPFAADPLLQAFLRWRMPPDLLETLAPGLLGFGQRMVDEVQALGQQAESHPPRHVPYDAWGARIDQIEVSGAWKRLQDIAAQEGLISIAYERKSGAFSRLDQFSRLYMFHPDAAWFTGPLAMTDGAARALELHGDDSLKDRALSHLLSRKPADFWTAGQWVTESSGGSDVSRTATLAKKQGPGYTLAGTKFFTSATASPMALTLARIEGSAHGSAGLSLFYVELFDDNGRLRDIRINRLREKLGTRAMPTAELILDGTPARLVGDKGHGVRKMASVFNLTRMHNTVYATAFMRRALALAKDYAGRRQASGRNLIELPAHAETLACMQVEWEGCFHLTFHLSLLLGREEAGEGVEGESALLRLLTPVAKLFSAKRAVRLVAEAMESFGGAGYMEDTGVPALMRDTLALPIWEGTTNVLALDVLRAMERDGTFEPFAEDVSQRLRKVKGDALAESARRVRKALETLQEGRKRMDGAGPEYAEAMARPFAYGLARTYIAGLLLEFASWMGADGVPGASASRGPLRSAAVAMRWCREPLVALPDPDKAHRHVSSDILLEHP
jgi:putative acyl-CoA dehydrogenase